MLQGVAPIAFMQQVKEITRAAEERQERWLQVVQTPLAHRAREDHSFPPDRATTFAVVKQAIQEAQAKAETVANQAHQADTDAYQQGTLEHQAMMGF